MTRHIITITEELHNERVDKATAELCSAATRSQVQRAIKEEKLSVNGEIISNLSHKVKHNDEIIIDLIEEMPTHIEPVNIPLDIVHEDEDLIVINKAVGMTTHPGAGNHSDTLVNALLYHSKYLSDIGGEGRPGIVHRLDKDTSGLMVVAKNNSAHAALAEQLQDRVLKRAYKALVWGVLKPVNGTIEAEIGRSPNDRKKMAVVKKGGKSAITNYNTLEIYANGIFSLVECHLDTGRTHQIRVHMSHKGHSIVGDQTYGNNRRKIGNIPDDIREIVSHFDHQALHSYYISFVHPTTGKVLEFEKDVPEDYNQLLKLLS